MTKEYLFGKLQVLTPIIARDTVSITQVNATSIKLKLKNRIRLIFEYKSDKDWSIKKA